MHAVNIYLFLNMCMGITDSLACFSTLKSIGNRIMNINREGNTCIDIKLVMKWEEFI